MPMIFHYQRWPPAPVTPASVPISPFEFDLSDYLSNTLGVPFYPIHYPEQINPLVEVLPCYTYTLTEDNPQYLLDGKVAMGDVTYTIEAHSYKNDDCVSMAKAVANAMTTIRGTHGNHQFNGAFKKTGVARDDAPVSASDRWTYHRGNQYRILYLETT